MEADDPPPPHPRHYHDHYDRQEDFYSEFDHICWQVEDSNRQSGTDRHDAEDGNHDSGQE